MTGRQIDVAPNVVYEPKGLGTSVLDKSFLPEIEKGLNKLNKLPTSMFDEIGGNGKQSLVNVLKNIIDTLGNNASEKMLENLKEYTDLNFIKKEVNDSKNLFKKTKFSIKKS